MFNTTDDETVEQLAFNLQWHFALDLPGVGDAVKYISRKTLWTMRRMLSEKELDTLLFSQVTDKLAKVFSVDTRNQRLDSVHITSNMRRLGRIGIFVRVITRFLLNLRRHHRDLFESLGISYARRYLTREGQGAFSMVRPSESDRTLEQVASDLFDLVRRFAGCGNVTGMSIYKHLSRVLSEQCTVDSARGDDGRVAVKPAKEIRSDSLQNPSDPDAGYSNHKRQGYQAQIMETYCSSGVFGEEKEGEKGLQLITYVAVEPAHKSDAGALLPALSSSTERGLAPGEVLADSPYGSDNNVVAAAERGVAVVFPLQGPKMDKTVNPGGLLPFFWGKRSLGAPMGPLRSRRCGGRRAAMWCLPMMRVIGVLFAPGVQCGRAREGTVLAALRRQGASDRPPTGPRTKSGIPCPVPIAGGDRRNFLRAGSPHRCEAVEGPGDEGSAVLRHAEGLEAEYLPGGSRSEP